MNKFDQRISKCDKCKAFLKFDILIFDSKENE